MNWSYDSALEKCVYPLVEPQIQEEQRGCIPQRKELDKFSILSRIFKHILQVFCGLGEGIREHGVSTACLLQSL